MCGVRDGTGLRTLFTTFVEFNVLDFHKMSTSHLALRSSFAGSRDNAMVHELRREANRALRHGTRSPTGGFPEWDGTGNLSFYV